jgi:hypothetical protein
LSTGLKANVDGSAAIQVGGVDAITLTSAGAASFVTSPTSLAGSLAFTGTGNRITGDFSNATVADRVAFQTSTANSTTNIGVIPNGTGNGATYRGFNNSDPTNASQFIVGITGGSSQFSIQSTITGTGTYLPLTFYTGGSETARFSATAKTLILSGGDTTANGTGITFPATQSASSNANTLDDYEEGTWTPSLGTDATQPTGVTYDATYRKGRYVKIGRMVFVEYIMILANKGTGGTGASTVTGLPFAHSANDIFPSFTGTVTSLTTGRSGIYMQINSGASNLVALYGNGGTATSLPWSDLANNSDFRGTLCYEV